MPVIMNKIASAYAICEVLGVDPAKVMSITMTINHDGVFFDVKYPLATTQVQRIAEIVKAEIAPKET